MRSTDEVNTTTSSKGVKEGEDWKVITGKDCWEVISGFNEHSFNDALGKNLEQLLADEYWGVNKERVWDRWLQ